MVTFFLGSLCGVLAGLVLAAGFSFAQLVPFTAPLEDQIAGQQAENWLKLNRDLEARERSLGRQFLHDPLLPCR